jgi:predicted ABC-type ATPase
VPRLIIIAGPNGAGKTTFAREYLSTEEREFEFVNADEIVRADEVAISDIEAGRRMLDRIDELVERGVDFVFETTLASLIYARKIPPWRKRGYRVTLIYLRLASVSDSLARVRKRVLAGGHDIPREAIVRRFDKSFRYFEAKYKSIVDMWYLWESREGSFALLDSQEWQ